MSAVPVAPRFRTIALVAAAMSMLLAVGASPPADATYPGENGLLVFVSSDDHGNYGIYTSTPSGGDRQRISGAWYAADPSWSASGKRIVYLTDSGHIWTMRADGSDKQRVTRTSAFGLQRPTFSPNGKRILYSQFVQTAKGRAVYTVKTDGTDRRRIGGRLPGGLMNAVYSPSGTRIAFEYWLKGDSDPYASGIYTMKLDGTGLRRVTGVDQHDRSPNWSPSGGKIVFVRTSPQVEIHVIRTDGSERKQLTHFGRDANGEDPVWAPNGARITFVCEATSDDSIWTMRPDGTDKHKVINGPAIDNSPDWQPT